MGGMCVTHLLTRYIEEKMLTEKECVLKRIGGLTVSKSEQKNGENQYSKRESIQQKSVM